METKTLTRALKAFITLAMLQSPVSFEAQAATAPKGGKCQPAKQCGDAVKTAKTNAGASSLFASQRNTGGQSGGGGALQDASTGAATAACTAQSECNKAAEKCQSDKSCDKEKDCKQIEQAAAAAGGECQQAAGAAAGAGETKNAATGSGDASGMMAAVAPLAMMAAMMAMQKKKKDDKPLPPNPNSAWNGVQLDCSKPDAHMFQACNGQMEQKCSAMMDDPTCVMFESRYCVGQTGTDVTGSAAALIAAQPQVDPATGMVLGVPVMGSPSEGVGSQFCANFTAYNFCKGAGRSTCPSCQRLQANASAICAQRPADCLQSNSPAVMQQAAQTCPTDPAFANPNWAGGATGGSGVPSTMSGVAGGGGGTILPQSVGGKAGNLTGNVMNKAAASSAGGNGTGAMQEGRATGSAPGQAGGGGTASATYNGRAFGTPGSSRELASSTTNFRPASLNGDAPASDIQARNSPNLFQTGSSVIKNRCETGRLNCP